MEAIAARLPDSSYQRQLEAGFSTLRFKGPLEKKFRRANRAAGLPQLRVALVLGLFFGFAICALDYFLQGPGFSSVAVPLRTAITQPLLMIMLLASCFERSERYLGLLGIAVAASIGGGSLFLDTVAIQHGLGTPFTGYLVLTFYTYLFLGLRFWPAFATAGALFVAYLAVQSFGGAPAPAILYNGLFLLFANLIGAVGLYNLEYSRRESFLEAKQLTHIATHDALTGLVNRTFFDEHLHKTWSQCARENQPIALAMVDIDHFKAYNDTYGHQAGDRCLARVAGHLSQAGRRPLDLVSRFGGEEFVVLMPGAQLEFARERLAEMIEQIQAAGIEHRASPVAPVLTVSAGLAHLFPHDTARSAQGLIQLADEAMYEAKTKGRNQIAVASEDRAELMQTGIFQATGRLRAFPAL